MEHGLNAGRIAVNEKQRKKICEAMVYLAGRIILTTHLEPYHFRELFGQRIAYDRNDADSTTRHHWESQGIVTTDYIEVTWLVLDNLINLFQIATGFLYSHDVLSVTGKADSGLSLQVYTSSSRYIIEDYRELRGSGNCLEVLVQSFLRRLVIIGADT